MRCIIYPYIILRLITILLLAGSLSHVGRSCANRSCVKSVFGVLVALRCCFWLVWVYVSVLGWLEMLFWLACVCFGCWLA